MQEEVALVFLPSTQVLRLTVLYLTLTTTKLGVESSQFEDTVDFFGFFGVLVVVGGRIVFVQLRHRFSWVDVALKVAPLGMLLWLLFVFCLWGGLSAWFMQCAFDEATHHAKLPQLWLENLRSKLAVEIGVGTSEIGVSIGVAIGVEIGGVKIGVENCVDFLRIDASVFHTPFFAAFLRCFRHLFFMGFSLRFSHNFSRHLHGVFHDVFHTVFHGVFHMNFHQIITASLRHHLCWLRRACGGLVMKSRRPVDGSGGEVRTRGRCQTELLAINRNLPEKQWLVAAQSRFQSRCRLVGRFRICDRTSQNEKYKKKSTTVDLVIPGADRSPPGQGRDHCK